MRMRDLQTTVDSATADAKGLRSQLTVQSFCTIRVSLLICCV